MSKREIIKLASILLGLGFIVGGLIPAIGLLLNQMGIGFDFSGDQVAHWYLSENIINVIVGLILLLFADSISRLIFSGDEGPISSRGDYAEVAVAALGLYVFMEFISSATELVREVALTFTYNVSLDLVRILPEALALLLYIIVGLWLIRSAKSLSAKITGETSAA